MHLDPDDFQDPGLLELALTHSSTGRELNNERLEFLGDAALDLIVAEELFLHHSDLPEGDLTELKASVVSRRTLAEVGRALELEAHAVLGRGLEKRVLSRSVMANLYEAVLGAIYIDRGLEAARVFALDTLSEPLGHVRARTHDEVPKQVFQELCQKRWGTPPRYVELDARGRAHARAFLLAAEAGGERFPSAWGRTRKEAEHWAAHEALIVLDEIGDEE